jgi:hypothetical protein
VWFARGVGRIVRVLVMRVVRMDVLVLHRFVPMVKARATESSAENLFR